MAAAATFVFGGALWALLAPLLPIIAAITAVVAVVTLLIVYWDELTAGVQNLTGGMFDMWDVLLLGIPIIGQLVMAVGFCLTGKQSFQILQNCGNHLRPLCLGCGRE